MTTLTSRQPLSQKISELQEKLTENFDERRQLIELCDKMEAKHNANLQLEKQHSEKMRWVKNFTTDCTTEQMMSLLQTISSKTDHITELQAINSNLTDGCPV